MTTDADSFERDELKAEIARLKRVNAALRAACAAALSALGDEEINDGNRHDPETLRRFGLVLDLTAALDAKGATP